MKFLPVQDSNGKQIGHLMLENSYAEVLKKEVLVLGGIHNEYSGQMMGYSLGLGEAKQAKPRLLQKKLCCKRCGTSKSTQWWKCCPKHTTEKGVDVLCDSCAQELHPNGLKVL